MIVQLDLFYEKSETEILQEQVNALEKSIDKQRRSLFARNADLAKKYCDLQARMEILEHNICKGKI